MLPWVCAATDYRRHQNVAHSRVPHVTIFNKFLYLLNIDKYEIHKFTSIYIFAIILLKIIKRYSVGWKFL